MSTWETRELPVLRAVASRLARKGVSEATVPDIAAVTGLDEAQVIESLRVLSEAKGPYVEGVQRHREDELPRVTALTDRARHELAHLDWADGADATAHGEGTGREPDHIRPPGAAED